MICTLAPIQCAVQCFPTLTHKYPSVSDTKGRNAPWTVEGFTPSTKAETNRTNLASHEWLYQASSPPIVKWRGSGSPFECKFQVNVTFSIVSILGDNARTSSQQLRHITHYAHAAFRQFHIWTWEASNRNEPVKLWKIHPRLQCQQTAANEFIISSAYRYNSQWRAPVYANYNADVESVWIPRRKWWCESYSLQLNLRLPHLLLNKTSTFAFHLSAPRCHFIRT